MPYSVTPVQGLQSSLRLGIAFLESETDAGVDGKEFLENLTPKLRYDFNSRFDLWLSGRPCDKYFHGWPNDKDRKGCFVFKKKEAGTHHRLYGFLINPRPLTDPGFKVCVLVSHAQKNSPNTDPLELEAVMRLRNNPEVIAAVKRAYPERTKK